MCSSLYGEFVAGVDARPTDFSVAGAGGGDGLGSAGKLGGAADWLGGCGVLGLHAGRPNERLGFADLCGTKPTMWKWVWIVRVAGSGRGSDGMEAGPRWRRERWNSVRFAKLRVVLRADNKTSLFKGSRGGGNAFGIRLDKRL
jgi:hypothetical protein